jgi:tRNA(Ile)-lysidine synthase
MKRPSGESQAERLTARFREANRRWRLRGGGERVLVAVSGGPDSVALLHLLRSLHDELSLTLGVAHLDHGLRGAESQADARYVKSLARRLDLPVTVGRADVPAYATEKGLSLETAARELRYSFLEEVAEGQKYDRVALGHTASDRVETVLQHLLQGTGLYGLRGMPAARGPFIRPLLTAWRSETEAYCRQQRLRPRLDATNLDPEGALRNRLRHELLPQLRAQFNQQVEEALLRLAEAAEAELDWTEPQVQAAYRRLARENEASVGLDLAGLRELPPGLRFRVWREAWTHVYGNNMEIRAAHYEALERLLEESQTGRKVTLPEDFRVEKMYNELFLGTSLASLEPDGRWPERVLPLPGRVDLPEIGVTLRAKLLTACPKNLGHAQREMVVADADRVAAPLRVRPWQAGDTLIPLGMSGHKKLQDLFVDEKVPARQRERLPLVVDGAGTVVWVVGVALSETVRVTSRTRRYLRMTVKDVSS